MCGWRSIGSQNGWFVSVELRGWCVQFGVYKYVCTLSCSENRQRRVFLNIFQEEIARNTWCRFRSFRRSNSRRDNSSEVLRLSSSPASSRRRSFSASEVATATASSRDVTSATTASHRFSRSETCRRHHHHQSPRGESKKLVQQGSRYWYVTGRGGDGALETKSNT